MALSAPIRASDGWFLGEDKDLDFTIYVRGTTKSQIAAGTAQPQDITGWALSWMLKRHLEDADADAILEKTVGSGVTITAGPEGNCTVFVEDTDTDTLPPARYFHELKRMDPGLERVLSYGEAALQRAVHVS